jgi:phage/plasmid-like protein (TIGR03299 family)
MSHELDFSLGRAAIAIRHDGSLPWHGYADKILEDELDDLDAWQRRGGIDFNVDERPIFYNRHETPLHGRDDGTLGPKTEADISDMVKVSTPVPSRKALVRSDTQDVLSVVSDGYHVVQPREILEFYRDLIADQGFKIDTVGALSSGRRIWALARAGDDITIMGQDRLQNYLLLATSFDGSMATIARPTSVRVVCANTMSYALSSGSAYVAIPHTTAVDWDRVKGELGLLGDAQAKFEEELNILATFQVDLDTAIEFFKSILGKEAVRIDGETGKSEYSMSMKKLFTLYEVGPGSELASAHHTGFGLLNAVTRYQDFAVGARDNSTRMNSAWFGAGAHRKNEAFKLVKALAGIRVSEAA